MCRWAICPGGPAGEARSGRRSTEDSFRTFRDRNPDEADIAYAFNQYHLISARCLVDDNDVAVGVTPSTTR